jgi:hypothetical protein
MKTVTVDITSFTGNVLFSAEVSIETEQLLRPRAALEIAVKARANLEGADLEGAYLLGANLSQANLARANLVGANLVGTNLFGANLARANLVGTNLFGANLARANLVGANLVGTNLFGAYLRGADLRGADLGGANLEGAYLRGADLGGANLEGATLVGERPVFQLGPIGSESRYFIAYITDKGSILKTGCFTGTREEFLERLDSTHGENIHAQEYKAALAMIDAHVELWTPEKKAEVA